MLIFYFHSASVKVNRDANLSYLNVCKLLESLNRQPSFTILIALCGTKGIRDHDNNCPCLFLVPPKEMTILVSPSSILEEGSSVNLTCSSDGFPVPKVLWSKQLNNGDLQPFSENTTVTLISMRKEDSGIYVCEGFNPAGISRKEVELVVQGELAVINELLLLL